MILCKSYLIKKPVHVSNITFSSKGIAAFVYRTKYIDYYISDVPFIEESNYASYEDYYFHPDNSPILTKELVKKYFIKQEDI